LSPIRFFGGFRDNHLDNREHGQLRFVRRGALDNTGQQEAMAVCHCHDFASLALPSDPTKIVRRYFRKESFDKINQTLQLTSIFRTFNDDLPKTQAGCWFQERCDPLPRYETERTRLSLDNVLSIQTYEARLLNG
jgi:hypothetical protein